MKAPGMILDERLQGAKQAGLRYQVEFERVLDIIATTRMEKCIEYGETRYEERDDEFNRWMLFSDVHRKYIRLRQQLNNRDTAGLIETYSDLAAYALMAVQILSRKETRDEV